MLGAATVTLGRRTTAAAWAPALLWPLAGAEPAAAALAALAGALLLALRLHAPGRAVAGALAAGALAVLAGTAVATAAEPATPHPVAQLRAPDLTREAHPKPRAGAKRARDAGEHDADATRAGEADAPAGNAGAGDADAPRAGEADAPAGNAGAAVRAYYRALDARRFDVAWGFLAAPVRASFGGFERWRAGFATTRSSRPGAMDVAEKGGRATVAHVLAAVDATACGSGARRFALTWTLERDSRGAWRAVAVTGRPLGGTLPAC